MNPNNEETALDLLQFGNGEDAAIELVEEMKIPHFSTFGNHAEKQQNKQNG